MTNQTEYPAPTSVLTVALITTTGELTTTTVPTDKTLQQLRALIGCTYVDVVRLADNLDMWLDEEGLLCETPTVNRTATRLARAHGYTHQSYVGNVVLTGGADHDGHTRPLDPDTLDRVRHILDL